jgi:hypothetical protein
MFAALTQDHKFLTLAVVNATESEQHFDLTVTGAHLDGPSTLSQMTGKDLDSAETPSGLTDSARNTSCLRISEFVSQFRSHSGAQDIVKLGHLSSDVSMFGAHPQALGTRGLARA